MTTEPAKRTLIVQAPLTASQFNILSPDGQSTSPLPLPPVCVGQAGEVLYSGVAGYKHAPARSILGLMRHATGSR